jgi:hypothetical protein
MSYLTNVFLRIEEKARKYFEKYPFIHAFLAGFGVILFWRGAWEIADMANIGPLASVIIGCLMLGGIGLFIQTFVGNAIIIKSVEKEKQAEQKTEKEVKEEEVTLAMLARKLEKLEAKIDSLKK